MTYGATPRTPLAELINYLGSRLVAVWLPGMDPVGPVGAGGRGPIVELNDGVIVDLDGRKAVQVAQGMTPPRVIPGVPIPDTDATFLVIGRMDAGLASSSGTIVGNDQGGGVNKTYYLDRDWNNHVLKWADLSWSWISSNLTIEERLVITIPAYEGASFGIACDRSGTWCGMRLNYNSVVSRNDATYTYNFRDTYVGGSGPSAGCGCTISLFIVASGASLNDPTFLDLWDRVQQDFLVRGYGNTPFPF